MVTAILIAARDCFSPGLLAIGSDGEWDDWAAGARLYQSVTGRKALSPLEGAVHDPEEEAAEGAAPAAGPRPPASTF